MANIAMLGTGLIGMFYTMSLTTKRGRDKIMVVCGSHPEKTQAFAAHWGIPSWTTDYRDAIQRPDIDLVVIVNDSVLDVMIQRLDTAIYQKKYRALISVAVNEEID